MTAVPVQAFRSSIELFESQVRDDFGCSLVKDILDPMSAEYQCMSEISAQTMEDMSEIKTRLDNNRSLSL